MPAPSPSFWWRDATSSSAFPTLRGRHETEVAIVGAGLAGLTLAYLLKQRGVRVAVVERRRVGSGTTGRTTAKLTVLHGAIYAELSQRHGREVAAAYAQANLAGLTLLEDLAGEVGIADQLEERTALSFATTATDRRLIDDEFAAAEAAGLPVELVEQPELGYPAHVAIRLDHQAQLDPLVYLRTLADAVDGDGSAVFEGSPMITPPGWDGRRVTTLDGELEAERVVLTTGVPPTLRGLYFARAAPQRSYIATLEVERLPTDVMAISVDEPTRSVRTVPSDEPGRRFAMVGGEGHVTGRREHPAQAVDRLVRWADEHFGVRRTVGAWSAQDYRSADGLPLVGALWPLDGRCLVATGFGKWGLTNGSAAALVLADLVDGRTAPSWAEPFDPTRVGGVDSVVRTAKLNGEVAKRLAGDWAGAVGRGLGAAPPSPLEGEGDVVREGTALVARSCVDGVQHRVSAVCPHLGGVVTWNDLERSWDCPLHGSRFAADGRLLEGPTTNDLASLDGDDDELD
jgi:glycine/D-amino acid oxidase-like deaminating enzyme/nitrite reductase/ring-hydroxylating ferredoxin subunit